MAWAFIPNNEAVVLVAGIAPGGKIVKPPEGRVSFYLGTHEQATGRAGNLNMVMGLLGIVLLVGGWFFRSIGRRQQKQARRG